MTMTKAEAIRATVDATAVAVELARWPAAAEIPAREISDGTAESFTAKLPGKLIDRLAEIERRLSQWCGELRGSIGHYTAVMAKGARAISDYDLTIAHDGDAIDAIHCALMLKAAHISYERAAVAALLLAKHETERAIAESRCQLTLF